MTKLSWLGPTEQAGTLCIYYKSGGAPQPVRWVRKTDAEQMARDITSTNALHAKRIRLRASYIAAGATEQHPHVIYLDGIGATRQVYHVPKWQPVQEMFDMPRLGKPEGQGVYIEDIERVELINLRDFMFSR